MPSYRLTLNGSQIGQGEAKDLALISAMEGGASVPPSITEKLMSGYPSVIGAQGEWRLLKDVSEDG